MAFSFSPKIVTDGLVLALDAANQRSYVSGSTVWNDLSPNLITGSLVNGPTFNSANGGSVQLDGSNDYVLSARPTQIVTGGSITVSLWAKWTTIGTTQSNIQVLVDNNHSSSPIQGFILQDRPDLDKKLTFSVIPDKNGATSSIQIGDGTWKYIVGTHQPGISRLYINGSLDGFFNESNMVIVQPNISLGYWQFTPGRYLNGNISNIQIYNRALSAQEVLQNYNALKSRFNLT